MELKFEKNMSCRLASRGKWGSLAAAWMGLSFFLRMVWYFGLMNFNDLAGGEIAIHRKRAAFTLLANIQEEVHRSAIRYHRQRRKGASLSTTLTEIEGIGPTRAKALLRQFGSLKGVQNATVEELLLVKGMTRPAAEAIERYFQSKG